MTERCCQLLGILLLSITPLSLGLSTDNCDTDKCTSHGDGSCIPLRNCSGPYFCGIECSGNNCEQICKADICDLKSGGGGCSMQKCESQVKECKMHLGCSKNGCEQTCMARTCDMECSGSKCTKQLCENGNVCTMHLGCSVKDCDQTCKATTCDMECSGGRCTKQLCENGNVCTMHLGCSVKDCDQTCKDKTCDMECSGGRCTKQLCENGNVCTMHQGCSGKDCDQTCKATTCDMECSGGKCTKQLCENGDVCTMHLGCSGKDCEQTCKAQKCDMECSGGKCTNQLCENGKVCSMHCNADDCTQTCKATECHMTRNWPMSSQYKLICSGDGTCCGDHMSSYNTPPLSTRIFYSCSDGSSCTCVKYLNSLHSTSNLYTSNVETSTGIPFFATKISAGQGTEAYILRQSSTQSLLSIISPASLPSPSSHTSIAAVLLADALVSSSPTSKSSLLSKKAASATASSLLLSSLSSPASSASTSSPVAEVASSVTASLLSSSLSSPAASASASAPTAKASSSTTRSSLSSSSLSLLAVLPSASAPVAEATSSTTALSLSSSSLSSSAASPSASSPLAETASSSTASLLLSSSLLSSPATSASASKPVATAAKPSAVSSSSMPSPSSSLLLVLMTTTVSSSTSPSPGTSPSSTLEAIKNLAHEYVSELGGIEISGISALMEATKVFENFIVSIQTILKRKEEIKMIRKSTFDAAVALEEFALNYGKYHLTATNSSVRMDSQKLVLAIQKAYRQNASDFYVGKEELQANMKLSPANFVNNVSVVVRILYKDLHEVLFIDEPFTVKTYNRRYLDSVIKAVAVDPKPEQLQENVILDFRNLNVHEGERKCMFWSGLNGSSGRFSESGCYVLAYESNSEKTVCSCDHMTHFAVLVDYHGRPELTEEDETILKIITYVGLSLSILGILLTIILYSFLTDIRQPLSQIRLSLSLALGAGQIIFLAGINATENKASCIMAAAFLQYFLMAGFCWMLVEGIYFYLSLVKVYNINTKMYMYHVISWGLPIVMVIISLSIASGKDGIHSFTSEKYCWLSSTSNLIWIFVAFVAFIEILNILILIRVVKEMSTLIQPTGGDNHMQQMRLGTKTCAVMIPVLGITWVFGLLLPLHKAFAYIFTIFNSAQGILIFVLHCVRNSQIKERLKRKMSIICPSAAAHRNAVKKSSQVNPSVVGNVWAVKMQPFKD